jgi:hypothetical protein
LKLWNSQRRGKIPWSQLIVLTVVAAASITAADLLLDDPWRLLVYAGISVAWVLNLRRLQLQADRRAAS